MTDSGPRTTSTQVRHPRRAVIRTVFQLVVASATLLPYVAAGITLPTEGAVAGAFAQVLAVAATITRIMAMPQVVAFLERFVPWLAPGDGPEIPTA